VIDPSKPTARIEQWRFRRLGDTLRLEGVVFDHHRPDVRDGDRLITSTIRRVDTNALVVETHNTTYYLGDEDKGTAT